MLKLYSLLFIAVTLNAQKTVDQKLDQILKQQSQILKEQTRIRKVLEEADAPPPPVKVDITKSPIMGLDKAPVTIVEFTDFQCPYCSKFHTETFPKIHDLIVTGKVRFVSQDFPLEMHKNALQAAEAGRCAKDQGHFWEMRDWMQSNPDKLSIDELRGHAIELDLDLDQYQECMATGKYKVAIENDLKAAQKFGISGTPAFVIGKSGSIVEGNLITGALPYEAFEKAILAIK